MRNKDTPSPIFRSAAAELGRILLYECVREWLPTMEGQLETPLGVADVTFVDPMKPILVVPVLRAGLVLLESAGTVLPASQTFHVGYVRDDKTLEATCYLNKLPQSLSPDAQILVSDPMLATGTCPGFVLFIVLFSGCFFFCGRGGGGFVTLTSTPPKKRTMPPVSCTPTGTVYILKFKKRLLHM